ncbi:hypothetical protein ACOIDN_33690, partial [Klebsiella pneumoniae]|uniref:hypothetical protein n=1 Tax=Klebsiella pneumoniae TaxID=573 RepID=UPI003B58D68E
IKSFLGLVSKPSFKEVDDPCGNIEDVSDLVVGEDVEVMSHILRPEDDLVQNEGITEVRLGVHYKAEAAGG